MKTISKATLLVLLATAVSFFVPAAAHADTYLDYSITGDFQSGGTLSGFFVIDTTNNTISDGTMMADGQTFTCPDGASNGCDLSNIEGFLSAPGEPTGYTQLDLNWVFGSPTSGFNFTLNNSYCAYCYSAGDDNLISGSAVLFGTDADPSYSFVNNNEPVSTPEPTSGVMLTLGLIILGFAGLKQRSTVNNA